MSEAQSAEMERRVTEWIAKHSDRTQSHGRLTPPEQAKTLRLNPEGEAVINDGLIVESGEIVRGYALVAAGNMRDVVAMVKEWSVGSVKIREIT